MSTTELAPAIAEQSVKPFDKPSFGDIPIQCIRASLTNPRKIFADDHLADLAASISKHGVAQPILVRPRETDEQGVTFFEIVAGERRYRASKLAGMPTVPAIVRDLSDLEALEIQVIENLQRQDLHPLEEAEGYEVLMAASNFTAEQMAEKVGKSKAYIYASLKLCALVAKPRKAFYDGDLTKSTALLVARIPVKSLQEECVKNITGAYDAPWSTRRVIDYIERHYTLDLKKATFKPADATLCPAAGSCIVCPNRAGNQPEIFADISADVCTDPVCFKSKTDAHVIRIKQLATSNGQTVISGAEAKKIMPNNYSSQLKGGYIDLDAHNHHDAKGRTFRQILGKQAPATTLLENPHGPTILEVVKTADIAPLLKEKGIAMTSTNASSTEREKEQEAAAKVEREYRTKLFTELHHASVMINLVDDDLRLLARVMFTNLPSNTIPTKLVMSLYGWTEESFTYPDREGKLIAAIAALSPAQLNQFIRDCALSHDLHVNVYTTYKESDKPQRLLAMAARAKVDAKAIRKVIDDEARAKIDAKKKVADKKAAKTAPRKPLNDFAALAPAGIPEFIKANPERLDALAEYALENEPLFIGPIERTAAELGYVYGSTGFTKLVIEATPAEAINTKPAAEPAPAVDPTSAATEDDHLDMTDFETPPPAAKSKPKAKAAAPAKTKPTAPKVIPASAWPFPKAADQAATKTETNEEAV